MPELERGRWTVTAVLGVLVLALGAVSFDRAYRERYDFHHFYLDARYVWQHGQLNPDIGHSAAPDERQLPFYLPAIPVLLAPLGALDKLPAAVVWSLLQVAAIVTSLVVLRRWGRSRDAPFPDAPLVVAVVLALPAMIEAAKFNQLSYLILALVIVGVDGLERKPALAGGLLGVAAIVKLLPAIFLPWLVLKRRWSAVAGFLVATLVLAVVPPVTLFGPAQAGAYHHEWWAHNVQSGSAMIAPNLPDHFVDHRNQALGPVLARLTWPDHPFALRWQPATLAPATSVWLARGVDLLLLGTLFLVTCRQWRTLGRTPRHAEAAAYALGMLVFTPLLRTYYLVWALPALVLLGRCAADSGCRRSRRVGWSGLLVWAVGMVAWIWPLPRLLGVHWLMAVVLGALLLRAARADARSHAAERASA